MTIGAYLPCDAADGSKSAADEHMQRASNDKNLERGILTAAFSSKVASGLEVMTNASRNGTVAQVRRDFPDGVPGPDTRVSSAKETTGKPRPMIAATRAWTFMVSGAPMPFTNRLRIPRHGWPAKVREKKPNPVAWARADGQSPRLDRPPRPKEGLWPAAPVTRYRKSLREPFSPGIFYVTEFADGSLCITLKYSSICFADRICANR